MQNIKSVLIVAFTATIGVLGFAASAQASQDLAIQGRGQVKNLSIPADTAGFTLVVIDGPGKLATDESYGPFSREESSDTEQHFSATEESTESVNVQVLVIHTSSRDVSTLRVVLDHEEQEGAELPRAAFGLRWTQPTWGDKPHGALDGGFRFEKSIWKYSNLAFSGEV
ncbi:MAG: hypothetical protein Q8P56_04615, partial [Candidatus Uhrbacteria bacterium]|nr:hypothetical protein [Candidatus Uhrbacteria bacterium]